MKICALGLAGCLAVPTIGFCQASRPSAKAAAAAPPTASFGAATKGLRKFDGYFPFY